jgi:hypothetical protein
MPFNRDIVYIPTRADALGRFNISTPATPAALASLAFALDIEIVSIARFSNGDIAILDRKGRLMRVQPSGSLQWDVESRETTEEPRTVIVDYDDNVWVGFKGGKVAKFFGISGALSIRIVNTVSASVLQASDETFIVAYDDTTLRVVTIDIASATIASDFNIGILCPIYDPVHVHQLGMTGSRYYIPVRRKPNVQVNPGKYEILVISGSVLQPVLPLAWPVTLTGTMADATGNIFVMDEFSRVMRFLANETLFAIYSLESQGRLMQMALDHLGTTLFVVSDALFGEGRLHVMNPLIGVATHQPYSPGGPFESSDLTGYQRGSVIADPDIALQPPIVNIALVSAHIHADASVGTVITGEPGSALHATTVTCIFGTVPIEADGSFAFNGPITGAGPILLTFTGPGGSTPDTVIAALLPALASQGQFIGTKFGLDGGFIRVLLKDLSDDIVTTGVHHIRIKEEHSGLFWNGLNMVASDGMWIHLDYDDDGVWIYEFLPPGPGDYTIFFHECFVPTPVFLAHSVIVTAEKQQIEETLSKVKTLETALMAPASGFTNPATVGGYILDRLNRIIFLGNVLAHKARLVFPKAFEGIAIDVSRTFFKTNDTPLVSFTILDSITGEPRDLTGHTIHWRARTQPGGILIFDKLLELIDAKNGQAQVRLELADTDTSGSFVSEVEDIAPDLVTLSSETFNVTINPDLT